MPRTDWWSAVQTWGIRAGGSVATATGRDGWSTSCSKLLRNEAEPVLDNVRLFDAALHAPLVQCPSLVKLAERDDTVPAPSAAAVYNALGSHDKRSFATPFGHYEGGIANARRHALFRRLEESFVDPRCSQPWPRESSISGEEM